MRTLAIVLLLLVSSHAFPETPDTDWIEGQLKDVPAGQTIDQFLEKIPKEWFQKYVVFYHSRSLQGASIERPRIVSARPNRNFVFAFREPSQLDEEETIEIIETDGAQTPAQFAEVTFDRSGKNPPRIERNPTKCIACHGFGAHSTEAGFIWDHYPQNIGAFGSAHNGYLYSTKPPTGGQSKIPTPEFEEAAIKIFQETAEKRSYYRHLQNLKSRTYDDFGIGNFDFYVDFQAFHVLRFWENYFLKKPTFAEASEIFINSWLPSSPETQQTELYKKIQANLEGFFATLKSECNELMENDLIRTREIYDLYGTPEDKRLASTFQVMPPKGSYGLINYCYYGYGANGDENNFSPLRRTLIHYLLSGELNKPSVFLSTDFFRKNAYITSGGNSLLFLNTDFIESYLQGSIYTSPGYNELPRSARQMSLTVPSFYRLYQNHDIKTIVKLNEITQKLERILFDNLSKMKDPKTKEYFTPSSFPGLSEDFWIKLDAL